MTRTMDQNQNLSLTIDDNIIICRVSHSPMDKENVIKSKSERRSSKRSIKPKIQESVGVKRKIIGVSDYPKPYKNVEIERSHCKVYLGDRKREHSVER